MDERIVGLFIAGVAKYMAELCQSARSRMLLEIGTVIGVRRTVHTHTTHKQMKQIKNASLLHSNLNSEHAII